MSLYQTSKKYIFMIDAEIPRLIYHVTLFRDSIYRDYYFVDALDGRILHKISGTPTNKYQIRRIK